MVHWLFLTQLGGAIVCEHNLDVTLETHTSYCGMVWYHTYRIIIYGVFLTQLRGNIVCQHNLDDTLKTHTRYYGMVPTYCII
jgi:hypothetical protein